MVRPRPSGVLLAGILSGCALALPASLPGAAETPEETFVKQAVDAYVAFDGTPALDEEVWALAAAPLLDFRAHPAALGRLWVEEIALASDAADLWMRAHEEAAGSGEAPRAAMARLVGDLARGDGLALLHAAARLYVSIEPEASPSRLRVFDLEAGALDAAAPPALTIRHRTLLPDGEADTLRFVWPPDGGEGAAVVRYVDAHLPPDVVFFSGGDRRAISLSGVARIDFVVSGSKPSTPGLRAPVECVRDAAGPFSGLEAHAAAGPGGPRLTWTTSAHEGIWGWALFREELLHDGRVARSGPELVPSSEAAAESFSYAFVDTSASPGTFYRYTVWAVTGEGLLARAFSATLETGRLSRRD